MMHKIAALCKRLPRYWRVLLEKIKEKGFLHTLGVALRWAYYLLIFEKVEPLKPVLPTDAFEHGTHPRIAVQIHCFYPEVLPDLLSYVNRIPYRFDCYVSTDTPDKELQIQQILSAQSQAVSNYVQCFPNRGRDIAPLLSQLPKETLTKYDYLLHLHSKKSKHGDFGGDWVQHLLTTLLDSPGHIAAILNRMEQKNVGMVFQATYYMVKPALGWHGNQENCAKYVERLGISAKLPKFPVFPAGNMFWAKTDAVLPVFAYGFTAEDFPEEAGQVEGTLAHCIERCWGIVMKARGYQCLRVKPTRHPATAVQDAFGSEGV